MLAHAVLGPQRPEVREVCGAGGGAEQLDGGRRVVRDDVRAARGGRGMVPGGTRATTSGWCNTTVKSTWSMKAVAKRVMKRGRCSPDLCWLMPRCLSKMVVSALLCAGVRLNSRALVVRRGMCRVCVLVWAGGGPPSAAVAAADLGRAYLSGGNTERDSLACRARLKITAARTGCAAHCTSGVKKIRKWFHVVHTCEWYFAVSLLHGRRECWRLKYHVWMPVCYCFEDCQMHCDVLPLDVQALPFAVQINLRVKENVYNLGGLFPADRGLKSLPNVEQNAYDNQTI